MARRKRRSRGKRKIPLATVGGILGTLSVGGASNRSIVQAIMGGNLQDILYQVREKLAGVDANGQFHWEWLLQSYMPVIAGAMVSKFVGGSPLNLNQKLKDIPFIKI